MLPLTMAGPLYSLPYGEMGMAGPGSLLRVTLKVMR